jgi:hypothetical protein
MKAATIVCIVMTTGVEAWLSPRWHGFWLTMFLVAPTLLPLKLWTEARRLARAKEVQESGRGKRGKSA